MSVKTPLLAAAGFAILMSVSTPAGAFTRFEAPAKPISDVVQVATKKVAEKYKRRAVRFESNEKPGTIIVDTTAKFLYYVLDEHTAMRYGIGVGREGFGWSGIVKVGRKAEWPGWTPPKEMIARERRKGHILPAYMEGGPDNPLGARALYLYRPRGGDTAFRIHGTNQPWSIGQNMSSGCIRMMNKDVEHLYKRASIGAKVIVIGPGNRQGKINYQDKGTAFFASIFNAR